MKAAYFREEWLDKALQLLPNAADRAIFYESLMARAFGRELPTCNNPIVSAMYVMAESAIAADIAKYDAKCERNRENAQKRVAASGTQSQRVVASGSESQRVDTSTSTNTSSSSSTSTNTSSSTISTETMTDEREKYLIYCTLFTRGALDIQTEFDNFYNYYSSLGWKNNKGAPIVSKVSAAAMWRLSGDTCANIAERESWSKAFRNANTTSPLVWLAFRSMRVEVADSDRVLHIHIALNTIQIEALENACEKQLRALMALYQANKIEYHCERS